MTAATYDSSITMIGVSEQHQNITMSELGDLHMRTLKQMAEKAGIITPLYTATGWGMAAVIGNEALPVTAAYTYPFWAKPLCLLSVCLKTFSGYQIIRRRAMIPTSIRRSVRRWV